MEIIKSKVVVFGIGKFAEYVSYVINQDSPHEVVAFCAEKDFRPADAVELSGLPIVDFESIEQHYPPEECRMFIAIGSNAVLKMAFDMAKGKGYQFISYVSSKADSWDNLRLGDNVFVSEGSVAQPCVTIGDNTIIIISILGHHSNIGKDSLISCCTLGGNVTVGDNSFIGMTATVRHDTKVGADNIIGMGCIINQDTGDGEVYSEKPTKKRSVSSSRFKNKYL